MELKATKGISLKRSSMGSKKRKKNSFKRQKRRKAADIKYSMTEITRMARNRPVRPKKLKTPDFENGKEELLRLMKRIRPTVEKEKEYLYKEGCAVCSKDHFPEDCPCLDKIPPCTILGPLFDRVCNCCGKIGDECCRKGAYAILTRCDGCENIGHWYWENRCPKDWCRPSYLVEIPSIQELEHEVMQNKNMVVVQEDEKNSIKEVPSTEQSLENSLQNREEDDVKVDVGKDNKNKDEVMVEDDDSKEDDEAKGGNESSNQSRSKSCKAILTQSGLSRSKDVKAIEELTAGCYRSLRL